MTKTRIGMTVNALRKSSKDDEVIGLAKTLIKNWKKFLSNSDNSKSYFLIKLVFVILCGWFVSKGKTASSSESKEPKKEEKRKEDKSKKEEKEKDKKLQTSFPPVSVTTDSVRLKCREMLASALKTDSKEEDFEGKALLL